MKSRYNRIMVATFAYDNGLRRTSRTLGDTPGTQTTWVYGRQDNLPTAINSGIPGASFSYSYDANKNKLTEGISAPMANFGFNSTAYDPADRLTAWNRTDGNLDQAWDLSLVGNWATFTENQLQQTRTHDAVHQLTAIDRSTYAYDRNTYAYDRNGNLASKGGSGEGNHVLDWDFDNRLNTYELPDGGIITYTYDALGRRVSKTVPDRERGSVTTVFVGTIQALDHSPHAMQVVAEYDADLEAAPAPPARKFVYAEYIDEPVMMLSTSGATTTPYYYHQNSLYSVAALTDASGTVVERYAYSAYGKPLFLDSNANVLDPQASTIGNPYLFTGRRLDQETGLYYYRARMYDAELGRFVGRDPIGYEGGDWSLYRYVVSAPLAIGDPSGYGSGMHPPEYYYHAWPDSGRSTLPDPGPFPMTKYDGETLEVFAAKKCALACLSSLIDLSFRRAAEAAQIYGDAEAAKINSNPLSAENIELRHCFAAAYLAKRVGCFCAACLGQAREQHQYHRYQAGEQSNINTLAQSRRGNCNNQQGLSAVGCTGKFGRNGSASQSVDIVAVCKQRRCEGKMTGLGEDCGTSAIE
ncbi:MAG: RHS repeat-associated core domain-containing protein [Patescibacteria group bacterium]|nr:RHS repeat-associated core domain-containing protein [Patescibacteria group bacterium]